MSDRLPKLDEMEVKLYSLTSTQRCSRSLQPRLCGAHGMKSSSFCSVDLNPSHERLLKTCSKSKLIRQPDSHLCVLQHVRKANSADSVLCGVDVFTGVFERTLDYEGRWVASFRCACVIGAGVAALCLDVGDGAVLEKINFRPAHRLSI
jgi:hypothetical protein